MEYDLSIIVPIYNGEKYIRKTIDNLLKIEQISFEILIINDGSIDQTTDIIKKYYNKDNITFINLEQNKGVSYCRNLGIEKARGNYIGFMDIDDEVEVNIYPKIIQKAKKNNLDICGFNYMEKKGKIITKSKYILPENIINQEDSIKMYLKDKISPAIWDKIFNKKILENIKFEKELRIGEDILFCLQAFLNAHRIQFINEYCYYYIQQEDSAMHQINSKLLQFKMIAEKLTKEQYLYLEKNYKKEFEYFKSAMLLRGIHAISVSVNKDNKKEAINLIKKLLDKNMLRKLVTNEYANTTIKIEVFILVNFGLKIHLRLMPIYKWARNKMRK